MGEFFILLVIVGTLVILWRVFSTGTENISYHAETRAPTLPRKSPALIGCNLVIGYTNAYGEENEFYITVKAVRRPPEELDGDFIYLDSYCHDFDEERTFRSDRIDWLRSGEDTPLIEGTAAQTWIESRAQIPILLAT